MIQYSEKLKYNIIGRYVITGESVREIAKYYGVSKSTVGVCITQFADNNLSYNARKLLQKRVNSNKAEFRVFGKLLPAVDKNVETDIRTMDEETISMYGKDFYYEF